MVVNNRQNVSLAISLVISGIIRLIYYPYLYVMYNIF